MNTIKVRSNSNVKLSCPNLHLICPCSFTEVFSEGFTTPEVSYHWSNGHIMLKHHNRIMILQKYTLNLAKVAEKRYYQKPRKKCPGLASSPNTNRDWDMWEIHLMNKSSLRIYTFTTWLIDWSC